MRAWRKLAPGAGAFLVEDFMPVPLEGELRLAVEAVGICGTDLHIVDWHGGYEGMVRALPVTLGHEIAARVLAGDGLPPGTRVVVRPSVTCDGACGEGGADHEDCCSRRTGLGIYRDGGFAREMTAPFRNCLRVPESTPSHHAALAEPLTVAHEAVRNAAFKPGDDALVLGPGPIGLGAALFARDAGAHVTIVGRDDAARLAIAGRLGFGRCIDTGKRTLAEALAAEQAPVRFSAIIEATGAPPVLAAALPLLAQRGRLVIAGIHPKPVEIDVTRLVREQQSLIGSYRALVATWPVVLDWITRNPDLVEGLISARLPLARITEGFDLMRRRAVAKVIVEPEAGQDG
ncbi:MAG: alcohol dehydrogenase [Methylobacterium sp.]|nr:MAG: alcohol dehydrogenase [Methylobacterium sp.]